jgi:hypothetical protein
MSVVGWRTSQPATNYKPAYLELAKSYDRLADQHEAIERKCALLKTEVDAPLKAVSIEPMKKIDAHDRDHWTEIDVRDLMSELRRGFSIKEAAQHLCRSGTINEVRRKAEELGPKYRSDKRNG